jgi:hypothetical protein
MPRCANGHDSTTADYCDTCGVKIDGAAEGSATEAPATPAKAGAPTPAPEDATLCPLCGTPQTGRFCEADGYDFLTASLDGAAPQPATPPNAKLQPNANGGQPHAGGQPATGEQPEAQVGVPPEEAQPAQAPVGTGTLLVVADPGYFEKVRSASGPDAGGLTYPAFCPERRFALRGEQVVIGRHSRSRGIEPDVDLVGPPEDPGVSHVHAMLVAQPGGGWAVVDMESANGTYVNDSPDPIRSNTPVPLKDGDHIHVGAWTRLTLKLGA